MPSRHQAWTIYDTSQSATKLISRDTSLETINRIPSTNPTGFCDQLLKVLENIPSTNRPF
jgi:hypothetical protein